MQSHETAATTFKSCRNKDKGKPIGPGSNTRLMKRGDDFAVKLHDTDVVIYHADGSITLDTGGWQTVTTKERFNLYSDAQVWTVKGTWHIQWKGNHHLFTEDTVTCKPDGSVVDGSGNPVPVFDPESEKQAQKFRKEVGKYATAFIKELFDGKLNAPSNGDCWHCALTVADGADKGKGLGEATKDKDHIRSHVSEKYFVPSMLSRALDWRSSQAVKQVVAVLWIYDDADNQAKADEHRDSTLNAWGGFARKELVTLVRRYCLKELGLPH